MIFISALWNFFTSLFDLCITLIDVLSDTLINGLQFFVAMFTNVPLFLLDIIKELPPFMYFGLTGVFGLLFLVVILKLISLVRSNG